jgi:hypothetical protein
MSYLENPQNVRCDGEACEETATLPVALRSVLNSGAGRRGAMADWLFVRRRGDWQHFCPHCTRKHLAGLAARPAGRGGKTA